VKTRTSESLGVLVVRALVTPSGCVESSLLAILAVSACAGTENKTVFSVFVSSFAICEEWQEPCQMNSWLSSYKECKLGFGRVWRCVNMLGATD